MYRDLLKKKRGKKEDIFRIGQEMTVLFYLFLLLLLHILYTHRHLWGHLHQENILAEHTELWNRVELIRLSMAGILLSVMNNS